MTYSVTTQMCVDSYFSDGHKLIDSTNHKKENISQNDHDFYFSSHNDVCLQCVITLKHAESHLSGVSVTEGQPALTFLFHLLLKMELLELCLDESKNILSMKLGKMLLIVRNVD